MSMLSKIGTALGQGGLDFTARLDNSSPRWGEIVRGTLTVQGGKQDQTLESLRVSWIEQTETVDSEGDTSTSSKEHGEKILASNLAVAAGQSQSFPFEIQVPGDANLSDASTSWFFQAKGLIPRAVDPSGRWPISVLPPLSAERLAEAIVQIAPFRLSEMHKSGADIAGTLLPSKELSQHFDGVSFKVRESAGQLVGTLEINPQEHSLGDHLKALLRKDIVRHPLNFSVEALTGDVHGSEFQKIVADLGALLAPFMK